MSEKRLNIEPLRYLFDSLSPLAPALLCLSQIGCIDGSNVYRRVSRSGRDNEWQRFNPEDFEKVTNALTEAFLPPLARNCQRLQGEIEAGHPIVLYLIPSQPKGQSENREENRVAYVISYKRSGTTFYLQAPNEKEIKLAVAPSSLEEIISGQDGVTTVIKVRACNQTNNWQLDCFLIQFASGKAVVAPEVNDFGNIVRPHSIMHPSHKIPFEQALKVFSPEK